jgi:hypothetical protein
MPPAEAVRPDAAPGRRHHSRRGRVALACQIAALPWQPRMLVTSASPGATCPEEIGRTGAIGFVPKQELPNAPLGRLLGGG